MGYIKNGYDPKNPKNGKKWQKGMAPQKIYPPGVPNQEFAPLEVKNEKTGTVGKSRSLSGQVLWGQANTTYVPREMVGLKQGSQSLLFLL